MSMDYRPPLGSSTKNEIEQRTISAGEITAKELTLLYSTSDNKAVLIIKSAPGQFQGDDYTVSGDILSWNGKALESELITGDKVTIIYNKDVL